jgi:hypothetical protein
MIANVRRPQDNRWFWVAHRYWPALRSGSIALFCVLQLFDLGGYVASYNVDRWMHSSAHALVDLDYVGRLGPGSWGALQRLVESNSPFSMPTQLVLARIRSKIWQGSLKKGPGKRFGSTGISAKPSSCIGNLEERDRILIFP